MSLLIEGRAHNRFNIQDRITSYLKTLPDYEIWKTLFCQFRAKHYMIMNEEERAFHKSLPREFKVYRGFNAGSWHRSLSWTLSEDVAKFFSHYCTGPRRAVCFGAYGKPAPMIAEATVRKIDIMAYFDGRCEKEVIIDPGSPLKNLTFHSVPMRPLPRKPCPKINREHRAKNDENQMF